MMQSLTKTSEYPETSNGGTSRLRHLLILLDTAAPSFCYYTFPSANAGTDGRMSPEVLEKTVDFIRQNELTANLLIGSDGLPSHCEKLLSGIPCANFVACGSSGTNDGSLVVINGGDREKISGLAENAAGNVVLRLSRSDCASLQEMVVSLRGKCKRINLVLTEIQEYTDDDVARYQRYLEKVRRVLEEGYRAGYPIELSVLSDRLFLSEMKNCNAGIEHLTVAPNGKFYRCPGFYYDDENDSVGDLETGIAVKNPQLLLLENAPICSQCDAYHCKRCIYLNKKLTLEVNTPSRQQCVISHAERNASRELLHSLRDIEEFKSLDDIGVLSYTDPFDLITRKPVPAKPSPHTLNKQAGKSASPSRPHGKDRAQGPRQVFNLPPLTLVDPSLDARKGRDPVDGPNKKESISRKPSPVKLNPRDLSVKELLVMIYEAQQEILRQLK